MAQQEISLRRLFLIQSALPKDIASISQNEDLPVKEKLYSGDVEKSFKSAREAHKHSNKSTPNTSGQRHHPYKRQPYGRPFFLGQSGAPFKRYHSQKGRGAKQATFQRVWETPEAVVAASQEEAVSPENLMDEVSGFYGNTEAIKTRLTDRSSKFAAGQIQHCLPQWQEITHEEEIIILTWRHVLGNSDCSPNKPALSSCALMLMPVSVTSQWPPVCPRSHEAPQPNKDASISVIAC